MSVLFSRDAKGHSIRESVVGIVFRCSVKLLSCGLLCCIRTWYRVLYRPNPIAAAAAVVATMSRLLLIFLAMSAMDGSLASPAGRLCSKSMDIAFLADKSGSIGREGLNEMKIAMEKVVDYFGMSDEGNHYAIMEFGRTPRIIVSFNTFTGEQVKSANLKLKIKHMDRIDWSGGSFIDKALFAANNQLFTVGAGMRPNASKVVCIMTDGIQTKDRGPFTPLHKAKEGLVNKGVHIISVGISRDVDVLELLEMATDWRDMFHLSKQLLLQRIQSHLCPNSTTSDSLK